MNTQSLDTVQVTGIVDNTAAHSPIVINAKTYANSDENNQYYMFLLLVNVAVGNYIDFNITFPIPYQIRFTCTPNNGANSFAANGTINIHDRIAQLINDNPILSNLFSAFVDRTNTGSGNILYIISKNTGSQFNLANIVTTSFNGASINHSFFDVPFEIGSGQKISDLYLFCDVRLARAKTNITQIPLPFEYSETQSFRIPFNKFDNHYFDISDFLKNYLSTPRPIDYSTSTMRNVQTRSTAVVYYSMDFGYIYSRESDIPIKTTLFTFKDLKAFNAALPRGESNNFDRYVKGVTSSGLSPVRFLTNKTSQVVKRNGFNVLYFWLPTTHSSITLKYYIEFKDGSRTAVSGNYATYQTSTTIPNGPVPTLYYIMHNVNDFITSQERINNKTAAAYSLVVVNQSNQVVVSERNYKIDDKFYEFQYDILYQNSLGGYDTVQFTGKSTKSAQRDLKQYISSDLITYKKGDVYQGIKEVNILNNYQIKSGWMKFKEIDDLKELLKSTDVYKIDRINQSFESIQIISSDYSVRDGEDLYQITITVNDTVTETSIIK